MNDEAKADAGSASDGVWNLETRFLAILENTSDIIYSCDISGNLTFINKAAEEHTGYTSSELLKMNISEIVAPEHLSDVAGALKHGASSHSTLVVDIVRKDGQR